MTSKKLIEDRQKVQVLITRVYEHNFDSSLNILLHRLSREYLSDQAPPLDVAKLLRKDKLQYAGVVVLLMYRLSFTVLHRTDPEFIKQIAADPDEHIPPAVKCAVSIPIPSTEYATPFALGDNLSDACIVALLFLILHEIDNGGHSTLRVVN